MFVALIKLIFSDLDAIEVYSYDTVYNNIHQLYLKGHGLLCYYSVYSHTHCPGYVKK